MAFPAANSCRSWSICDVHLHKLDRISRSILDFANMMELSQEYDVEFVSSTEKFDTSTPMGQAMLNICIVFAQLCIALQSTHIPRSGI